MDREYAITHDSNAFLIWIQSLDTFSQEIHENVLLMLEGLLLEVEAYLPIGQGLLWKNSWRELR